MKIEILNLAGNTNGWEDELVNRIRAEGASYGHDVTIRRAHGAEELMTLAQEVAEATADLTIVVAHGNSGVPGGLAGVGLASSTWEAAALNNYYLLPSLFPALWRNHKLLIICDGLNADSLAALNVGMPGATIAEDAVLIAKQAPVLSDEAIQVCKALLSRLPAQHQGRRPTGEEVRRAFDAGILPTSGWSASASLQIEETDD